MQKKLNIGFIGGGNMAQALIAGMLRSSFSPQQIFVHDLDLAKLKLLKSKFKIATLSSNQAIASQCSTLVLATKPQDLGKVLAEISPALNNHLIISIAAGLDTDFLSKHLKGKLNLVRAMPNNPALIGKGITALYSKGKLSPAIKQRVEKIFKGSGEILWISKESQLNAVTGLSGSGPAYVYRFVAALAGAGVRAGLSEKTAYSLALKTTVGAALTLEKTQKLPAELIPLVTSKKGTTLAGLKILDQKKFDAILEKTVLAAARRAEEITKELKDSEE